jgi:hypothetical protein
MVNTLTPQNKGASFLGNFQFYECKVEAGDVSIWWELTSLLQATELFTCSWYSE